MRILPIVCDQGWKENYSGKNPGRSLADISAAQGFTLIELLIVVAVLAIISAVAIPQFNSYREKCSLAAAVTEICSMIREAKCSAFADGKHMAIGFDPTLGKVKLISGRGGDGTWNTADDPEVRSFLLSEKAGGIRFGYGSCGPLPGLAITTDGITFQTGNTLVCNPDTTGNAGSIYLVSRGGDARALTMNSSDFSYTLYKWNGKKWVK